VLVGGEAPRSRPAPVGRRRPASGARAAVAGSRLRPAHSLRRHPATAAAILRGLGWP